MPRSLTVLAGALLALSAPGVARAADLYVSGSATATSGCTQAAPCSTIQQGVRAAIDAGSAPSTVHVAGGSYPAFSDPSSVTPITVEGSATEATTVTGSAGPLITLSGSTTGNLTIRNLHVDVPGFSQPSNSGIAATGGQLALENVDIVVEHNSATGENGSAVVTNGTALTARNLQAHVSTDKPALDLTGPTMLEDSYVVSDTSASPTITGSGPSAYRLVRTQVAKTAPGHVGHAVQALTPSGGTPPAFTLDSSLIRGGDAPLFVSQASTQTADVTWTLQNATVDSQGSTSFEGLIYSSNAAGDHLVLHADSSILVDKVVTFPNWTTDCTYSDVSTDSEASGASSCHPGVGQNSSGAEAIFPGPDSYVPKYESRVVDTGNPSPPAGFSATDLQRVARKLPGHGGCVGFLDRGAVEYDGSVGTPPAVTIAGPSALVRDTSGSFTAPGDTPVTYKWTGDDGATGAAATFTHAFATVGSHTVTLVATRPEGTCTTTVSKTVTVTAPAVTVTGGGGSGPPVTEATTPAPGTPPPTTGTPPPRDTTKPTVRLVSLSRTRLRVKVSEAAKITAKLCAKRGAKTRCTTRTLTAAKATTLATTLKKLPRGRITLTLTAVDAAGNTYAAKLARRLR